jgi:hypothetical protein
VRGDGGPWLPAPGGNASIAEIAFIAAVPKLRVPVITSFRLNTPKSLLYKGFSSQSVLTSSAVLMLSWRAPTVTDHTPRGRHGGAKFCH